MTSFNIYVCVIFQGIFIHIVVVQSLSRVQLFATQWTAAHQAFPVLHYLPEFAQTHVRWLGDAIQPSRPLLPLSSPALSLSQHQDLFQWVGSSHQVAKVLELQLQSFQWMNIQGCFPLGLIGLICLQSKGLSRVFSNTTVPKHHSSVLSLLYGLTLTPLPTWLLAKP